MENNFVKIKEQILAIRTTGKTNMFDVQTVQRTAFDKSYYELVNFIEINRKGYTEFILSGKEPS